MTISKSVWERLRAAGVIDTYDKDLRNTQIRKAGPWKLMKIAGIGPRIAQTLLENAGWKMSLRELENVYEKLGVRTTYHNVVSVPKKKERPQLAMREKTPEPPKDERKRRYLALTIFDNQIFKPIFKAAKKDGGIPYDGKIRHKILHITLEPPKDILLKDAVAKLEGLAAFEYPLHFLLKEPYHFKDTKKIMYGVSFPFKVKTATDPHMTVAEFESEDQAGKFLSAQAKTLKAAAGKKMDIESIAIIAKEVGVEYALPIGALKMRTEEFLPKQIEAFLSMLGHKKPMKYQVFKAAIDGKRQGSGRNTYVNSPKDFIALAQKDNGQGIICVSISEHGDGTAEDISNIAKLLCLIIDVDVKKERKVQHVSSQRDHLHAIAMAYTFVKRELEHMGFQVAMIVDSGNGAHVYVKVGIPLPKNTTRETWQQCEIHRKLIAIELRLRKKLAEMNDDIVSIDFITKDAVRRIKVPGTLNIKNTAQAENRLCRIVHMAKDYAEEKNNTAFSKIVPAELETMPSTIIQPTGSEEVLPPSSVKNLLEKNERIKILYTGGIICHGQDKPLTFKDDKATCKSRSEAELALVSELIRHGMRNFSQVDEIMMASGIGKWQEDTKGAYRQRTFERAFKSARSTKTMDRLSPVDRLLKSVTKIRK